MSADTDRIGASAAGMPKKIDLPYHAGRRWLFVTAMLAAVAVLLSLGMWQINRLHWKHALVARVTQRVHAAPVAAPGPSQWAQISAAGDEYRHVRLEGRFLYQRSTRVQAVTELGSGSWLLTPFLRADGTVVLVNRGFVATPAVRASRGPTEKVAPEPPDVQEPVTVIVTGLLRMSEPGGAFLRHNDPAAGRWFSRDVQALAAASGLHAVAPYFVDADAADAAAASSAGAPIGGLTVIAFADNHLVYALTWFSLALMGAGAMLWVIRDQRGARRLATLSNRHPIHRQ